MSARAEIRLGVLAAVLAIAGILLAIFAPATYSYDTSRIDAGPESLWTNGIGAATAVYLAIMVVAALSIGVGAYLHSREIGSGLAVIWTSATVFLGGALLALPGSDAPVVPSELHADTPDSMAIGVYLILPAVAAIAIAMVIPFARRAPRLPGAMRPRLHG